MVLDLDANPIHVHGITFDGVIQDNQTFPVGTPESEITTALCSLAATDDPNLPDRRIIPNITDLSDGLIIKASENTIAWQLKLNAKTGLLWSYPLHDYPGEEFEDMVIGPLVGNAPGLYGSFWEGGPDDLIPEISTDAPHAGTKSIKFQYPASIQIGESFQFAWVLIFLRTLKINNESIPVAPVALVDFSLENTSLTLWVKIPAGLRGNGDNTARPFGLSVASSPPTEPGEPIQRRLFFIELSTTGAILKLAGEAVGVPLLFGTSDVTNYIDGAYHKYVMQFNRSGTYFRVIIDDITTINVGDGEHPDALDDLSAHTLDFVLSFGQMRNENGTEALICGPLYQDSLLLAASNM